MINLEVTQFTQSYQKETMINLEVTQFTQSYFKAMETSQFCDLNTTKRQQFLKKKTLSL